MNVRFEETLSGAIGLGSESTPDAQRQGCSRSHGDRSEKDFQSSPFRANSCVVRKRRKPEGVVIRHGTACGSHEAPKRCDCQPGYQAQVYSAREGRTIRKTFRTLTDARAWRVETQAALNRGALKAPSHKTVAEAIEEWLEGAKAGVVRTRSGDHYKPAAIRGYKLVFETQIIPRFGALKISELARNEIQDLVDELLAIGKAPSTVRNAVMPLRVLYRRLISRSEVLLNPTVGLTLPAIRERRERIARPEEARELLEVLSPTDRTPWATALYGGLRRGELRALRWGDVDFEAGLIRVERGWDPEVGPIEPKSRAGKRRVPLAQPLRSYLAAHRLRSAGGSGDLVFTGRGGRPLAPEPLIERARAAWKAAGLKPILLHECRHTYAAFMIAAGVNAKALSSYMGHSTISMTLDRYGHLMPGNENEAAVMLADYLERDAQPAPSGLLGSR
jgi:integrase